MKMGELARTRDVYRVIYTVSLFSLGGFDVLAQTTDDEAILRALYGDEEMIGIATGRQQPISKAPAVATVITAADIRAIGATDLDEILETVPGLHVARSFVGYNPIYTIRGVYSQFNPQVLVLINGIPITNLYSGDRNLAWGGMPVEAIARIEVMLSPGSALYGADAFAGVINIITKTNADIDGFETGGRVGSFDTRDAWALYGDTLKGFDVALMLEYHDTDGQSRNIDIDAQSGLDNLFGTTASLAPDSVNLERRNFDARLDVSRSHWRLRAGLQRRRDFGNGAGIAQALDPNNSYESDRWNVDLTYHNPEVTENWDVKFLASYFDTSQEIDRDLILFPPGTRLPIGSDGNISFLDPAGIVDFPDGFIGNAEIWERHYQLEASAFFLGFDDHEVHFGLGYKLDDLYKVKESKNFGPGVIDGTETPIDGTLTDVTDTPFVFLEEGDRDNYYFFVQDVWNFARDWELTAGIRYDDYSDFGDTLNPRLALVWSTRHDLTTKFLYGRAFRAPSFSETRNMNNPTNLGNPDLDPEKMDSFELAFDYIPIDTLQMGLSLFVYRWDDIIRFTPDPGQTSATARNTGEQTGFGLELKGEWRPIRNLRLLGNYAYQNSEDEDTNQDAGNAPQHQFYVRSEWEFIPDWKLNGQFNWVMDRERSAGDGRSKIDDYAILDLNLRRESIRDRWEIAVLLKNVFDEDAREPSPAGVPAAPIQNDLPLAGRSVLGEIRVKF